VPHEHGQHTADQDQLDETLAKIGNRLFGINAFETGRCRTSKVREFPFLKGDWLKPTPSMCPLSVRHRGICHVLGQNRRNIGKGHRQPPEIIHSSNSVALGRLCRSYG
jgi:hypothetical protein